MPRSLTCVCTLWNKANYSYSIELQHSHFTTPCDKSKASQHQPQFPVHQKILRKSQVRKLSPETLNTPFSKMQHEVTNMTEQEPASQSYQISRSQTMGWPLGRDPPQSLNKWLEHLKATWKYWKCYITFLVSWALTFVITGPKKCLIKYHYNCWPEEISDLHQRITVRKKPNLQGKCSQVATTPPSPHPKNYRQLL